MIPILFSSESKFCILCFFPNKKLAYVEEYKTKAMRDKAAIFLSSILLVQQSWSKLGETKKRMILMVDEGSEYFGRQL